MVSAVSDFPLPVSPTIAVIAPRLAVRLTPWSTSRYSPAGETKPPVRSRTARMTSSASVVIVSAPGG